MVSESELEVDGTTDCGAGEVSEPVHNIPAASEMEPGTAGSRDEEGEEEGDEGDEEEGGEGGGEEEEVEWDGCAVRFDNGLTPIELVEDDAEIYKQLERRDNHYEELASRRRKAFAAGNQRESTSKKARHEDDCGASFDEIMEAMNYGGRKRKLKKRGRRYGSRSRLNLEATQMLGNATLHYARGSYKEAIEILKEVVRTAPKFSPEAFHTLGSIYNAKGDGNRALNFYLLSAYFSRTNSPLWRLLITMSLEQGNIGRARYCLSKAIKADPEDLTLISISASLYVELEDYLKAAESYIQMARICPEDVEALKTGSKLFLRCAQVDRSISTLEVYLNDHPNDFDLGVIDLLASICMENNAHARALQHIEHVKSVYCSMKDLPTPLMVKAGICHVHLGNMEKAECLFSVFHQQNEIDFSDLVKVADAYMACGHHRLALSYFLMLEGRDNSGQLQLKIAQCYLWLDDKLKAIPVFYKALQTLEDAIDARLTLASLLLEEAKDDEAIMLLLPPEGSTFESPSGRPNPWWLDEKVKHKLAKIYLAKRRIKEFVHVIFAPVHDTLIFETKKRKKKKLRRRSDKEETPAEASTLFDGHQMDCVIPLRPVATPAEQSAANNSRRLRRKLERRQKGKAAALAAGASWRHDDSNIEYDQQEVSGPPLPNLLKDDDSRHIIVDLSEALGLLQRYEDAFKIINAALKLPYNLDLETLGARLACRAKPEVAYSFLKRVVKLHPHSIASWNCYYNVISSSCRPEYHCQRQHSAFLYKMQDKCKDWAPPLIISGHRYTMLSQHQAAAREYLEAYKLLPESPLMNLCVGTALINIALGFRLQNKHQCLAQGLAFLYNNLQLCENSQESLFNIARACHHIGLVSLAASYYEKVLVTDEKDYSIPMLPNENKNPEEGQKSGYCNLRGEAAYNLHLIYKQSGAFDLARQVLKDYCTL